MKQVVRKGFAEIVVEDVPDPMLIPHHVLVRPHYSLISSGTETASIHQEGVLKEVADNPSHLRTVWEVLKANGVWGTYAELKARFSAYAVLGYSGAGVVADKHPTVTGLEVGDRVAYGGEGTGHGETILAGRNLVARVPDAVPLDQACFATLGSIAMNAVRTAQIELGDTVAVLGLGLVGQLVAQLVRASGGVPIGIDLRPDRVELARKLGVDKVTPAGAPVRESVLAATGGRGADCVILAAAAKSDEPARLALSICRDRGRIVVVGAVGLNLPWQEMYLKEIRLWMSRAYGPGSYDPAYEGKGIDYPISYVRWTEQRNMSEFLRLCETGQVRVEPLITHRFALEEAPQAYQTILAPGSNSLAVVLRYPAAAGETFSPRRKVEILPGPRPAGKDVLGVALVGAGNIAKWAHLPCLKAIPGARLRAVVSNNGARGKTYGRRFGFDYCASDYEEVLRDAEVDAVVIANRNQNHARDAEAALRAGKHVFVEKPMALTEEECRALAAAVRKSGRQLFVGFNRRFAPFYRELKVATALRGGPAVINCRVNSPGISGDYWMADPAIGGAILGEACHFVDLFHWLLETEIEQVTAYSLPTGQKDTIGENNLAACFRFADGSVATLAYCTVGSKTSAGERVEVFAPGIGAITEDFKRLSVRTGSRRDASFWFAKKGYQEQMEAFVGGIRRGEAPAVGVTDGARATLGCLKMLESARLSAPCRVDLASIMALD